MLTLYTNFHLGTFFIWFVATRNPACQASRPSEPLRWYQGGPLITELLYLIQYLILSVLGAVLHGKLALALPNVLAIASQFFIDVADSAALKKLQQQC